MLRSVQRGKELGSLGSVCNEIYNKTTQNCEVVKNQYVHNVIRSYLAGSFGLGDAPRIWRVQDVQRRLSGQQEEKSSEFISKSLEKLSKLELETGKYVLLR